MVRDLVKKIPLPKFIRAMLGIIRNAKVLAIDYGQYKSLILKKGVNRNGEPIPWFSYPAIEYLQGIDFTEKKIFEYGSGNSTLFWAKRCKTIDSIENDKCWFDYVKSKMPSNVNYIFADTENEYVQSIRNGEQNYDVIIIDGNVFDRQKCAIEALNYLNDTGFIILDNSERYGSWINVFREAGLLQVDMHGFVPNASLCQCTSFFFRRSVQVKPLYILPIRSLGAL
jgi:hypothetical protein